MTLPLIRSIENSNVLCGISNSGEISRSNIPSSFFNSFRSHNSPEVSTVGRRCDCYEPMYDDLNHRKHGKVAEVRYFEN
jgi:hypothetical protein